MNTKVMIDFFNQYRENITLALSLFGAIGTFFTFISTCFSKRKNLKITVNRIAHNNNIAMMSVTFENRSSLPITIVSVNLKSGNRIIHFDEYPKCAKEYKHLNGTEIVDRKFLYNLNFPVSIDQFGASSGYILLEISQEDLERISTPLIFQVHSTRGSVQEIALQRDLIQCTSK